MGIIDKFLLIFLLFMTYLLNFNIDLKLETNQFPQLSHAVDFLVFQSLTWNVDRKLVASQLTFQALNGKV